MRSLIISLTLLGLLPLAHAQEPVESKSKAILTVGAKGHVGRINDLTFTPDGKQLITVGEDKTIQIWDVDTGERVKILRPPVSPQNGGGITCVAIAPDGKTLAVGSHGVRRDPTDDNSAFQHAYLLNLETGRILWLAGPRFMIEGIAFSADGDRVAACHRDRVQRDLGKVTLWKDLKDIWKTAPADGMAPAERTFAVKGKLLTNVVFAPDGGQIAAIAGATLSVMVWDLKNKEKDAGPPLEIANNNWLYHVGWRRDGKQLITTHRAVPARPFARDLIKIRTSEGVLLQSITLDELKPLHREIKEYKQATLIFVGMAAFRSDDELVAVLHLHQAGVICQAVVSIDLVKKTVRHLTMMPPRHDGLNPESSAAALSRDGQWLAHRTAEGNSVRLVPLADPGKARLLGGHDWPQSVAWGKKGQTIAWQSGRRPKEFHRLDLARLESLPAAPAQELQRALHQLDGWELDWNKSKRTVTVSRHGKEIRTSAYTTLPPQITLIGKNDNMRLARSSTLLLEMFDAASGKKLFHFSPGYTHFWDMAPAPDQKDLLTATDRELMFIYQPPRYSPLLTVFVLKEDWIIWTSEGYYAATPGGEKLMGWTVNNGFDRLADFHPAERFRKQLFRPDVIKLVLAKGSVAAALKEADKARGAATHTLELDELLPPRAVLTVLDKSKLPTVKLKVAARASAQNQPILALRLLLNGRPVPGAKTLTEFAVGQQEVKDLHWTFDLPEGEHQLAVLVRSSDSFSISPVVVLKNLVVAAKPATLHVLTVGINQYKARALDLKYAAPDAKALAAAFAKHCLGQPFQAVQVRTLLDQQATAKRILAELTEMRKAAQQQDLVVVFFACHGVKQQKEYYVLTHEADTDDLAGTSLAGKALRQSLGEFKCQVLLMLDTCFAGSFAADKKLAKLGLQPALDEATRDLSEDECAVAVLCASMGHEKAEGNAGRGLFTRAVLQALEKRPGVPFNRRNQRMYIHHLHAYVYDEVSAASEERQHPCLSLPGVVESFVIR